MKSVPPSLQQILNREYRFNVIAEPEGGFTIVFPDLPGCLTQVDSIDDIPTNAREARNLWLETEHHRGREIPLPGYPEDLSGKFNVRLPKSLHRSLVDRAEAEGVSLNQLIVFLLSSGVGATTGAAPEQPARPPKSAARLAG